MWLHLSAAMSAVGVLVIGGRSLSMAAAAQGPDPALPAAVAESGGGGISTVLLVAGIAFAFAVGLVAGETARRRRRGATSTKPVETNVAEVVETKPAGPAVTKAAEVAPALPPPERVAPAGLAPERPLPTAPAPDAAEIPVPLASAPERLGAATDEPAEAARAPTPRVVPLRAWPAEAKEIWSCEIEWKPGYRKSSFRAMATPPGGRRSRALGESAGMRWGLMADPEPATKELVAAVRSLLTALETAGWERIEPAGPWYSQRFLWRGRGEPGKVEPVTRNAVGT